MSAPTGMEYKTLAVADPASLTDAKPEGIVTAVVAVTGVKDDVGDVIVPGSAARTLATRKPKVCLGHDWNRPIGKTLDIKELMPGDPGLPEKTPSGEPWPAEAGAIVARALYNLNTQDGRDAYEQAKFYGPEECYQSIGYRVPEGGATFKSGVRYIQDWDLLEYGPVLHPANRLASLQGVKTDAVGVENKARYVKDSTYWGLPVGTLIRPGMRPKGATARKLRKEGKIPSPEVGTSDSVTPDGKPAPKRIKPEAAIAIDDAGGLFPEPDASGTRLRATRPTSNPEQHVQDLVRAKEYLADEHFPDERAKILDRMLAEGLTPNEVEEDLNTTRSPSDMDESDWRDLVDELVHDYRTRYAEAVRKQNAPAEEQEQGDESTSDTPAPEAPKSPAEFEQQPPPKIKKGQRLFQVTASSGEVFYRGSARQYSHAVLVTDPETGREFAFSFNGSESSANGSIAEARRRGFQNPRVTPVDADGDGEPDSPAVDPEAPANVEAERDAPAEEPTTESTVDLSPLAQQIAGDIAEFPESEHIVNRLADIAMLHPGQVGNSLRAVATMLHPRQAKKKRVDPERGAERHARHFPDSVKTTPDAYDAIADALESLGHGDEGDRGDGYGGISQYLRASAAALRTHDDGQDAPLPKLTAIANASLQRLVESGGVVGEGLRERNVIQMNNNTLDNLRRQGLVERNGREFRLTDLGRRYAEEHGWSTEGGESAPDGGPDEPEAPAAPVSEAGQPDSTTAERWKTNPESAFMLLPEDLRKETDTLGHGKRNYAMARQRGKTHEQAMEIGRNAPPPEPGTPAFEMWERRQLGDGSEGQRVYDEMTDSGSSHEDAMNAAVTANYASQSETSAPESGAAPEPAASVVNPRDLITWPDEMIEKEYEKARRTAFHSLNGSSKQKAAQNRIQQIDAERARRADAARRTVPAHPLPPAEYRAQIDRRLERAGRAQDIVKRAENRATMEAALTSSREVAASAPDTIASMPGGAIPVADGRIGLKNAGKASWQLVSADGRTIAHSRMFKDMSGGRNERAVKLNRKQADSLAAHIAAITNDQGDRIPFTSDDSGAWVPGFRDTSGRNAEQAVTAAIAAWAAENDLTPSDMLRERAASKPYGPLPDEPGKPDEDGFYPGERARDINVGDEVRFPDGSMHTIAAKDVAPGSTTDYRYGGKPTLFRFEDGGELSMNDVQRIDVRYAEDPGSEAYLRDPGMGWTPAPIGVLVSDLIPASQRALRDALPEPIAPDSRIIYTPDRSGYLGEFADDRPRVGRVTDRFDTMQGLWFQVVEYDDGTFDALNVTKLMEDGKLKVEPPEDQQVAVQREWGLEADEPTEPAPDLGEAPNAPSDLGENEGGTDSGVQTPPENEGEPELTAGQLATRATGNSAVLKDMTPEQLAAVDEEMTRRAVQLGKPGQVSKSHQAVRDELASRDSGGTDPDLNVGVEDSGETIATADMDEADMATDEAVGLVEGPDGELEVEPDVADRQDRVEALLDEARSGSLDLTAASDEEIGGQRRELVEELKFQDAVASRESRTNRAMRPVRPPSEGEDGGGSAPAAEPTEDTGPKVRPGIAGAAEDLADALEGDDDELRAAALARMESLLRRSRSPQVQSVRDALLAGGIQSAVEDGRITPETMRALAESIREERRTRANEQARKRRAVKRLERERIRALISEYDAELRRRNLNPDEFGGVVPAGSPEEAPPTGRMESRPREQDEE